MTGSDTTTYRWSRAYGLRIFALAVTALAVVWVLAAVLDFAGGAVVALVLVGLLAALVLLRLVAFPLPLLEISNDGYRLRSTRGGGVRSAPWRDVESIASEDTATGSVMVIRLADERSTVVPLGMLGSTDGAAAERDIHARLNTVFGYRRLDGQ